MAPTVATRTLLAVMLGVGLVGCLDAARADAWDLVVVLGLLVVAVVALLVSVTFGRPLVTARADLVRWIARRAAISGESPGAVVDRALAAYRSGLTGDGDGADDADRGG